MTVREAGTLISTRPRQSGVALLQVLLLGAIISLLAIRFTETARDQISIAGQFEDRVLAQFAAHSAFREIIFFQLSDSVEAGPSVDGDSAESLIRKNDKGFNGAPIKWRQGVSVEIQDLNGLLPQIWPQHPLWERLLIRKSIPEDEVARYLGIWQDLQDNDIQSWMLGDVEPSSLPAGQTYPNGLAQSDKLVSWVFADQPPLVESILEVSDVHGTYNTNPLNYSDALLNALFDPGVAQEIMSLRSDPSRSSVALKMLLPSGLKEDYIFEHSSGRFKLDVTVELNSFRWREKRIVHLRAGSQPPFRMILNN